MIIVSTIICDGSCQVFFLHRKMPLPIESRDTLLYQYGISILPALTSFTARATLGVTVLTFRVWHQSLRDPRFYQDGEAAHEKRRTRFQRLSRRVRAQPVKHPPSPD